MVKTYVLMLSKVFPSYHPRRGQLTHFAEKLQFALYENAGFIIETSRRSTDIVITEGKKHTIRKNYDLWHNRAFNINSGQAVLSIRQWEGKPYRSKQKEIMVLNKIEVQKIKITNILPTPWDENKKMRKKCIIDRIRPVSPQIIAKNDGLSYDDFDAWFKKDFEGCIIHFTDLLY